MAAERGVASGDAGATRWVKINHVQVLLVRLILRHRFWGTPLSGKCGLRALTCAPPPGDNVCGMGEGMSKGSLCWSIVLACVCS